MPRVSVCVATYNQDQYVRDCVMSVVSQANDVSLEILVGDDQSTDQTEEILRGLAAQYPDIIQYFRHESGLGPERNYQFLIGQARGDYIAHLDGDDYWLPGKLRMQLAVLEDSSDVMACYTNALCIDGTGMPLGPFNNPQPRRFNLSYLMKNGNFLNLSSMVYRAEIGSSICSWPPHFIDYKIHLMIAEKGDLGYVNTFGVVYRMNSSGSMVLNQSERVWRLYWEALCYVASEGAGKVEFIDGSADFLRRVAFRSIKTKSLSFFVYWWKVVAEAHVGKRIKLAFIFAGNIILMGIVAVMSRFASFIGGTRLRVLFWR